MKAIQLPGKFIQGDLHKLSGSLWLAQGVAAAAGTAAVNCQYQVKSSNENNWALMMGWWNGDLEYSKSDTLFGNSGIPPWVEHFPITDGSPMVLLLRQDNRGADPEPGFDNTPSVVVTPRARAREIHLSPADERRRNRYDIIVPLRKLDGNAALHLGYFVAPADGLIKVDYQVYLAETGHGSPRAECKAWVNGSLEYDFAPSDGFGTYQIDFSKEMPVSRNQIVTFVIFEWNQDTTTSSPRRQLHFWT